MATGATFQNIFFSFVSPSAIPGCVLWLDGADPAGTGVAPSNGASVTTWVDKSGSGNSGTGGTAPSYNSSGINSKGVVSFNGSTAYLNSQDLYSNRSFSIFMIIRRQGSIPGFTGLLCGSSASPNQNMTFAFRNNTDITLGFYYNDLDYASFPDYTGNTSTEPAYLVEGTYTPGARVLYLNGTQVASDANSTNLGSDPGPVIGGYSGQRFNGFIGDIVILNGTPSSTTRQQVEGYLAWKWGLQATLPANHPYKNGAAPTFNSSQVGTIPLSIQKYRAFIPTQISGCQLWLDGADPAGTGILPANGETVSTWVDKSVNGYNATAAPSRTAGTYSTSFRAVNFPTSTTGYITNYSAAPTNETMFVVFNNPSASFNNNILIGGVQGARSLGAGHTNPGGSGSVGNLNTQVAWLVSTGGGTYTLGTTALVTSQFTTSTNTISLNGGTAASGGAPGFTAGRVTYLGVDATNGSFYYVGYAMEIIFYNSLLNTTECQQVEGYLAWKWGLQGNLPPTHPYKNINNNYNPFPSTTPAFTRSISSIFKPTNYTGCQLWLDAFDPFGNGSRQKSPLTLTRWVDKSSSARHANMFNGSSISYSPTAFNNKPAFLFTQTQNMSSAAAAGTFSSAFTFFIIYQRTGGGTYDTLVTRGLINLAAPVDFYTNISTGNFSRNIGNGTAQADYNTTSGSNFTNVTIPSLYYANATAANGLRDAFNFATPTDPSSGILTGVYYADNGTAIYIGTRADSVTRLTASVAEVIVYSTTPTDQQRQTIEGYLAWKWGLVASLPAGHPYKNYPPPPQ